MGRRWYFCRFATFAIFAIFANFANSPFLEFLARNFPPDVMRSDRFGDGPRQIARWFSTGKSDGNGLTE